MRKVTFDLLKNEKWQMIEGYFHGFYTDFDAELSAQNKALTTRLFALVELDNGSVVRVSATSVRFIDKPKVITDDKG